MFTVNLSTLAAQRRSQVKWLTPVKPEKNACPASALFQCSLVRSDAADAAAAGHKTTQRRHRPPVRRRTALVRQARYSQNKLVEHRPVVSEREAGGGRGARAPHQRFEPPTKTVRGSCEFYRLHDALVAFFNVVTCCILYCF